MTLYDTVKQVLTEQRTTRSDYKELIWQVYRKLNFVTGMDLNYFAFREAPSPESIRRTAQAIFASHPELRPNKRVRAWRKQKQQDWPEMFREEVNGQGKFI